MVNGLKMLISIFIIFLAALLGNWTKIGSSKCFIDDIIPVDRKVYIARKLFFPTNPPGGSSLVEYKKLIANLKESSFKYL